MDAIRLRRNIISMYARVFPDEKSKMFQKLNSKIIELQSVHRATRIYRKKKMIIYKIDKRSEFKSSFFF